MSNRIVRVEAFEIKTPLPRSFSLGDIDIAYREYTVVRVYDNSGNCGSMYALSRNAPISAVVKKMLMPIVLDTKFKDYAKLYEKMVASNVCSGSNGLFWRALSLLDCAIYDLMARAQGKMLCDMLAQNRSDYKTLLVGGYPIGDETKESFKKEMEFIYSLNPDGIKIGSTVDYIKDCTRIAWAREIVPDSFPLMVDVYWTGSSNERIHTDIKEWEKVNVAWIEDPFNFEDNENFVKLKSETTTPIAAGDEQTSIYQFETKLKNKCIDYVRLDATVCGGVTGFTKICNLAQKYSVPVSAHVYPHLHTHLAAAIKNVEWVEYIVPELGLESAQLAWKCEMDYKNGIQLPKGLGNGLEWDETKLQLYRTN